jgi:hypothetical protein
MTEEEKKNFLMQIGLMLRDKIEKDSIVTRWTDGKINNGDFVRIVDLELWNKITDSLCSGQMPEKLEGEKI